jgi:ATP-dependent helicase/nuclease subunit B
LTSIPFHEAADRRAVMEVRRVAYGEAATALLAEQVRAAKEADRLAPVTVIVPGNYAAVSMRRELARRHGGIAGATFSTLHGLAERLGGPVLAARGRRPWSAPVVAAAVRAAMHDDPGVLGPVAHHPATELAIVDICRELSGVSPEALDAVAAQSRRAADVVRLARTVATALATRWYGEHDLFAAATENAGTLDGTVIVHLPQELPAAGGRLLHALASHVRVTVDVGITGADDADRPVLDALARSGIDVPDADADADHADHVARPVAARIVSVSDPDEEARVAVRAVVDAARDGVPLGRMAILLGRVDPYARLVREHLDTAGIPANGTPVRTIGDMLAGRLLRALLALPDRRFRRADVLAVLSAANVGAVRRWERVSRAAGVVDGDDWAERLATFVDDATRRADAADADERPGLAHRLRLDADRARSLATAVAEVRAELDAGNACRTWAALARWSKHLLDRHVGDVGHDDRTGWPEVEREAADRVDAALDRLAGLDALGGPPPTLEDFRRTLDGELEDTLQRIGRLGDGVLVGTLSLAVGVSLDRVVVLGLAEGTFPDRRLDDALLPDRERAMAGGELALRSDHLAHDHRHLLAAVATGDTTLCFPRGDLRRPGERTASRWLLDDATELAGVPARLFSSELDAHASEGWLHVVPSFAGGLARLAFPATGQEHHLAALLRGDVVLAHDPVLVAGVAMAEARRSGSFTRFDGNLGALDLPPATDGKRVLSATRLQAWATCPHAYLLEHVLGVEVVDEPERRLRIDGLDRGSLVHEVLHRFVDGDGHDAERLDKVAAEVFDEFAARGRTGRQLFWRRDRSRILADLQRFVAEDLAWRTTAKAEPVATEHRFDTVMPLPNGRGLRVRGVIDRVDRVHDGSLVVVDYKTGRADDYKGLGEHDPHQHGTRLQPVVYAAGARAELGIAPVRFEYWFVSRVGRFERIGYEVTPDVERDVGDALATIVDGIERGVFPMRPPEVPGWNHVDCWFCAPDGLHADEARRDWERKRADPALAAYVALCEPEDGDGAA